MFRFAAGEPRDPLDLATFRVTVDGADRTRGFTVTADEAWGSLAEPTRAKDAAALRAGLHEVVARLCSARGACSVVTSTVIVLPGADGDSTGAAQSSASRRQRLIDLLLEAVRRLLKP